MNAKLPMCAATTLRIFVGADATDEYRTCENFTHDRPMRPRELRGERGPSSAMMGRLEINLIGRRVIFR